jgi:Fic family protein
MTADYSPPFSISSPVLSQVADITERVGRLSARPDTPASLRLRRINRIRTIHGTLAIEGNRLTERQITAILDGKRVLAPPREVQEVRNALSAYDRFRHWTPSAEADLLEAHRILMTGLLDHPGTYRSGGAGVMAGAAVVHMAPPASQVPRLMGDLLAWLAGSTDHALIASSLFHYELEFIHPFADGNGRMGRLWQTLILSRWRPLFAYLPIETLVHANQGAYYQAIQDSTDQTMATPFVAFMLDMIRTALDELDAAGPAEQATDQVTDQVTEQVRRLLAVLLEDSCSTRALMDRLGLSHRPTFALAYLRPALEGGWVEMTDPDHPRSPRQRYRLTAVGRRLATAQVQERRSP